MTPERIIELRQIARFANEWRLTFAMGEREHHVGQLLTELLDVVDSDSAQPKEEFEVYVNGVLETVIR